MTQLAPGTINATILDYLEDLSGKGRGSIKPLDLISDLGLGSANELASVLEPALIARFGGAQREVVIPADALEGSVAKLLSHVRTMLQCV